MYINNGTTWERRISSTVRTTRLDCVTKFTKVHNQDDTESVKWLVLALPRCRKEWPPPDVRPCRVCDHMWVWKSSCLDAALHSPQGMRVIPGRLIHDAWTHRRALFEQTKVQFCNNTLGFQTILRYFWPETLKQISRRRSVQCFSVTYFHSLGLKLCLLWHTLM